MAQTMPKNSLSEKLMKAGLVYTAAPDELEWGIFNTPSLRYNEARKHDPLVMIATFFCGNPRNNIKDRISILEAMYDSRHHAQERLWNGEDLKTSHVLTNVRLYPGLRIGYTEKIISIRNQNPRNLWNPSEEAIYTFHLPEGGVVTSLSLWINGKEEKAILTAKNKADSAYRTIVGRESRDPSLVRWQEGNTVSVRVFPCTPEEDRKFKIGFTAPLTRSGNKLNYQNIWFDGPEVSNADESIQLVTMDKTGDLDLPSKFRKIKDNTWLYDGNYKHDWEISLACPPLKGNNFSFDGQSYSISENVRNLGSFNLQTIYLDLNSSWSKSEFNKILKIAGDKEIFVFTDKLKKITPENSDDLFNELNNLNFSLFPFHKIKSPENSIVVTKGTVSSPNLSDLTESEFADNIKACFLKKPQIRVFNLESEISPFIRTLMELRAFEFDLGDIDHLTSLIRDRKFVINSEDPNSVVIKTAATRITQMQGESASNAPDHLMRLFSYNQVMSQIGVNYMNAGFQDSTIVSNAYKAYVVSPVTSLVVLETQKDYDRFNIKDGGASLKNASMKSSGAVPEPHEWLLIALMAGLVLFVYFRKKKMAF
jgi:XrtN system VIT domain protein